MGDKQQSHFDAAIASDCHVLTATKHTAAIERVCEKVRSGDISEADGARVCIKECDKGIDLLQNGSALGTRQVLDVLSYLRERRALHLNTVNNDDLENNKTSTPSAEIERRCRQQFDDATAAIDLAPTHSSPAMVRSARNSRMAAVACMQNLPGAVGGVGGIDRERQIALEDARIQRADADATESEREFAAQVCASLSDNAAVSTSTINQINSVKPGFLNRADLCRVEGLNVGKRGSGHFIARTYMDKALPVTMSDGTPKRLPPGVASIDAIADMTPSQLIRKYGKSSGITHGECVFWKRHRGTLLGKHKWEATGTMEDDRATCSELWDMRWVLDTNADAKNFLRDMLEVSRLGDNNGFLDGMDEVAVKSHETADLDGRIDNLVFCSNRPKKRPGSNNMQGKMLMACTPTLYLQQYTAVFVIDRVVVKLYIIEGYNPTQGKLERSCMFGPRGLLNVAAKAIVEWLGGIRKEFDHGNAAQAQWGDLSHCAGCGVERDRLQRCR